MKGYLFTGDKSQCTGCSACQQACPVSAIKMVEDEEGFYYPEVDAIKCIHCNLCHKVCPYENPVEPYIEDKTAFGGQIKNLQVRDESTSGGAFSAIVEAWCDENYVIFGAESKGLNVFHSYIEDKKELAKFRRSKYSQSQMGHVYQDVRKFLKAGKKVVFSGTPCQISGLRAFLFKDPCENLLTIEVICEGVPTPWFMKKYNEWMEKKYHSSIEKLDYRYKNIKQNHSHIYGKWDFEMMDIVLKNGQSKKIDRWFNPFWSIWLNHLMNRPSCYVCPYANTQRKADITLGDLWGVHLYCPELYEKNTGASLVVCNSEKGKSALEKARPYLIGHDLKFEDALKYQSPMRKTIDYNPDRELFMKDVRTMDYKALCKKWAKKPTIKLLWSKYVWGNRQKVFMWNLKNRNEG